MGKISDALERQKNERTIKTKMLHPANSNQKSQSNISSRNRQVTRDPVPHIQNNFDPKLFALSAPDSIEAENFKALKGHIFFPKDSANLRTVLITSAFPSEGKTFIASNLAVSMAQGINEHALLVDCDFRRPCLHKMLGYSNKEGLQEYLMGKKDLPELFIRTGIEKLSLLTSGSPASNPTELLSSKMMKALFEELKARYQDRYVIIDSAPCHVISEVHILAKYVDGIIFVVMPGKAPREIIRKCIEDLGKDKIIGIVFNGYEKAHNIYGRYYKNYYKRK